ncbi:hypothetical protein LGQ02_14505 [Bacillus shivajii]|uniref:hypothetical protein n=1 Tax=Bacillus shivajii TaxID=1983719 RepID=UPI001CF996E5|nr:hypothetical protein [Bacillus shivajii]UCZ52053.1 hypothetical protein LGQ02_14505 [Bacillus shivajii]
MLKTVHFPIALIFILMIAACSDENSSGDLEDYENLHDYDIDTLISTNEKLVNQLEHEREKNQQLIEQGKEIKEENAKLKDDILTYKQQVIQVENLRDTEQQLRNELDERSKDIFQAMHEADYMRLEEYVGKNIKVNNENEVLQVENDKGEVNTFHLLNLSQVNYVRQTQFEYDPEVDTFVLEYTFFTTGGKGMHYDFEVVLTYLKDGEWKLSSIMYN